MPPSAQSQAQTNAQMRAALLATAPRQRKNLQTFTLNGLGQTTRMKLFNVGVLTRLACLVTASLTIGGAIATPSAKAPYNFLTRVRLTDYDNTDRVNISGWHLYVVTCVRNRMAFGWNNSGPIFTAGGSTELSGIITNPNVPTAIATNPLSYYFEVPVAYDPAADLRGAILMQTAVGEMYLSVDQNSSLVTNGNDDAVYNGAGATTVVLASPATMTVWQEYLMPQAIGSIVPLPQVDLLTVYELNGMTRSSDNLAQNQEKLVSYPNVRSVIGAYLTAVNNSLVVNQLSQFRMIVNGNNVMLDYNNTDKLIEQRNFLWGDVARGTYWFLHRDKPIETALYGNVQAGYTPGSAITGTAYLELTFEDFYTKGSMLPGIQQAS